MGFALDISSCSHFTVRREGASPRGSPFSLARVYFAGIAKIRDYSQSISLSTFCTLPSAFLAAVIYCRHFMLHLDIFCCSHFCPGSHLTVDILRFALDISGCSHFTVDILCFALDIFGCSNLALDILGFALDIFGCSHFTVDILGFALDIFCCSPFTCRHFGPRSSSGCRHFIVDILDFSFVIFGCSDLTVNIKSFARDISGCSHLTGSRHFTVGNILGFALVISGCRLFIVEF